MLRLAEHHRGLSSFEHFAPDTFTTYRVAVGLGHGQCTGVELRRDFELVQRAVPLTDDAEKLK